MLYLWSYRNGCLSAGTSERESLKHWMHPETSRRIRVRTGVRFSSPPPYGVVKMTASPSNARKHYVCGFYYACSACVDFKTAFFVFLQLRGIGRLSYIFLPLIKTIWSVVVSQALLSQLSDKAGVTLWFCNRLVEPLEQRKIIQDAARKNTMQSTSNDVNETIQASENLQDVVEMLSNLRKNKEPLLHSSIFIELKANSMLL